MDDVTLGTTARELTSTPNDEIKARAEGEETQVHKDITEMGKKWETMIHVNGGLLELKKCFWIVIAWKWPKGVATLKSKEEIMKDLKITQSEDSRVITIPKKDVTDAPRVLGCHVAADGSWKREYGIWKTKAAMFAKKVKNAKFSRACGGRVYPSLWLSKIRYIAPVVCFSEDQSENINRKVVTQCLPASGYNRNFPRKVVYGPTKFGGMGWESCLSVMIVEKIKFITPHMRRMDILGTLLQILLEIIQLQSGLAESILVSEVKWQIWVEPTWVNNLKDGLDIIKGALHTNHEILQIQRKHDRSLMKVFFGWKISDKELKAIQRCRIYLQVIFCVGHYHNQW